MFMIQGILIINFDPAYIGFTPSSEDGGVHQLKRRYCSLEEIRSLLIEMDVIHESQSWPPRDLILRLPVKMSKELLEKFALDEAARLGLAS